MSSTSLTLLELNKLIKSTIEQKFDSTLWLVAEINNITEHRSGHCYIELVQKSSEKDLIISQAKATIWSVQYRLISAYFESVTNSKLVKGIKVLIKVSVDYHELYGLSLNIRDIDPNYTLGDLERRKKEITNKLINDGVFELNKTLAIPLNIQNIAVISSSNAAGFEDFINHLSSNRYGYRYNIILFEADMQGANTEDSIIQALNNIYDSYTKFDIVSIIRGGGAKSDLSFFDNYNIAYYITQFPLPIFSGIGHDRDDTITDMVSHSKFKTPTAVANYIIEHSLNFEKNISEIYSSIINSTYELININESYLTKLGLEIYKTKDIIIRNIEKYNNIHNRLNNISLNIIKKHVYVLEKFQNSLLNIPSNLLESKSIILDNLHSSLKLFKKSSIDKEQNKIFLFEQILRLLNPLNILKRGYSISKINGKIIKTGDEINCGSLLETITYNNKITSKVIKKERKY